MVRRGKGSRSRTVGVDAGTITMIDAWLVVRPKCCGRGAALFVTLKGETVSTSYLRSMLIRKSRKLGLPQLHPHALRHAYASELVREGVSVPFVSRLLGHQDLATTAIYLQSLGADEAVDVVRSRDWALA